MPLIIKQLILLPLNMAFEGFLIDSPKLIMGIWRLDEIEHSFAQKSTSERIYLLKANQKQAVTMLLGRMLTKQFDLYYDTFGKPFLKDGPYISISHTGNYVAVAINQEVSVGVDIELHSNKAEKVAHRILNTNELDFAQKDANKAIYTCLWCAKEALYKAYGKKEISFAKQLQVNEFEYNKQSQITGAILTEEKTYDYLLERGETDHLIWACTSNLIG